MLDDEALSACVAEAAVDWAATCGATGISAGEASYCEKKQRRSREESVVFCWPRCAVLCCACVDTIQCGIMSSLTVFGLAPAESPGEPASPAAASFLSSA